VANTSSNVPFGLMPIASKSKSVVGPERVRAVIFKLEVVTLLRVAKYWIVLGDKITY
jgi:hypothetical protein